MTRLRALVRAARGWQPAAFVGGLLITGGIAILCHAEWRRSAMHDEIRMLRARLEDKSSQLGRARREMTEVANAVDGLVEQMTVARDKGNQARRLAQMEESRDIPNGFTLISTPVDHSTWVFSEEAARAIEQLRWATAQTGALSDSIGVLAVLLKQRPADVSRGLPSFWPVQGIINSAFGVRTSPHTGRQSMHTGIDIQARYGTPVTSSGDGEILFAGRDAGYGWLVVVDHGGGTDTFYAHLSAIYVREGQQVRRGQPLGAVGNSGNATGSHLHYEVRQRGVPVNPKKYLN